MRLPRVKHLFFTRYPPRLFTPRPLPESSAYPTLRRKREGWGTRSFVQGKKYRGVRQDVFRQSGVERSAVLPPDVI
jgi:hypothetical protein